MATTDRIITRRYRDALGALNSGCWGPRSCRRSFVGRCSSRCTVWHMRSEADIRFRVTPKMQQPPRRAPKMRKTSTSPPGSGDTSKTRSGTSSPGVPATAGPDRRDRRRDAELQQPIPRSRRPRTAPGRRRHRRGGGTRPAGHQWPKAAPSTSRLPSTGTAATPRRRRRPRRVALALAPGDLVQTSTCRLSLNRVELPAVAIPAGRQSATTVVRLEALADELVSDDPLTLDLGKPACGAGTVDGGIAIKVRTHEGEADRAEAGRGGEGGVRRRGRGGGRGRRLDPSRGRYRRSLSRPTGCRRVRGRAGRPPSRIR